MHADAEVGRTFRVRSGPRARAADLRRRAKPRNRRDRRARRARARRRRLPRDPRRHTGRAGARAAGAARRGPLVGGRVRRKRARQRARARGRSAARSAARPLFLREKYAWTGARPHRRARTRVASRAVRERTGVGREWNDRRRCARDPALRERSRARRTRALTHRKGHSRIRRFRAAAHTEAQAPPASGRQNLCRKPHSRSPSHIPLRSYEP